jgi:hypothetical protein
VVYQEQSFSIADIWRTTNAGASWSLVGRMDLDKEFGLNLSEGVAATNGAVDHSLPGEFTFEGNSVAWYLPQASYVPLAAMASDPLKLFRSIDGGLTWHPQRLALPAGVAATDPASMSIKFFNDREGVVEVVVNPPDNGRIVEKRFVYTTADGGATWSSPIPVPEPGLYESMRYIDSQHWVGWPYGGGWLSTADAGQHWRVVPAVAQFGEPPASNSGLPGQLPASYPVRDLYGFVSSSNGWALPYQMGSNDTRGVALYVTSDGGINWTPVSLPELQ